MRTPARSPQRAAPPEGALEITPAARRRGLRERAGGAYDTAGRSPDVPLQPARGVPASVARMCTAGSRSEPPEDPLVRRVGAPRSSVVMYSASSSSSPPTCTTYASAMSPFAMASAEARDDASGMDGGRRGALEHNGTGDGGDGDRDGDVGCRTTTTANDGRRTTRVATTMASRRRTDGHDAWSQIAIGAPSSPAHPAERTRDEAQGPPVLGGLEAGNDDGGCDRWLRRRR